MVWLAKTWFIPEPLKIQPVPRRARLAGLSLWLAHLGLAGAPKRGYGSSMADGRPAIAIGHVTLLVGSVAQAESFYRSLGMRPIVTKKGMAILELRGGTHLLLFRAKGKPRSGPIRAFDLMVDDIPALRKHLLKSGMVVSALERDARGGHVFFSVKDPDGHLLTVYSSHAGDRSV
jgi:catechol 2,3-dioxygenase-like lactoylglutathione lyase family enzyme